MRTAFLTALEELAAEDPRINFVTGDLGFRVVESYAERFPEQFLNAGVAEQNMTAVAVGMALCGKVVFTYSIANFPTLRCLEQIRNDACYHNANLKVVSVGGGLAYGALGSSHHATEDLAIMRVLPGMTVVAPGDPVEAALATRAVAAHDGPCYLRLGKAGEPTVHEGKVDFTLGKAIQIYDGENITIVSTGGMLHICADVARRLRSTGLTARLLSMHTLKPLDSEAVSRAAIETGAVLTVEEHSVIGGLGSAVADVMAQHRNRSAAFKVLGLPDQFCRVVGDQGYTREASGLTADSIEATARGLIAESR